MKSAKENFMDRYGVIVAGGKSSRMGKDKALLPFGDAPTMTHYLYFNLAPFFTKLYVSAKEDKFGGDFPLVLDKYEIASPLVALVSIFKTLPHELIFFVSVDTPLIDTAIVEKLYEAYEEGLDAVVATVEGKSQPLCALYNRSVLPAAETLLQADRHTMRAFLKTLDIAYVPFEAKEARRFVNLNEPETYRTVHERLRVKP
jgi:molybdopterin-guanine dinucleotide biosynthesis protein A